MNQIKAIETRLLVNDLACCISFYTDIFGFTVGTMVDEFAILTKDNVRLQFSQSQPKGTGSTCTLWMDVQDVAAIISGFGDATSLEWGPEDYSYGRRECACRDPAGNLVVLSQLIN